MLDTYGILVVVHVLNAILMAWPYYALVTVNNRVKLGPPLGDRADVYMENIIKNRTIPCMIFQATALITGLLLILLSNRPLDVIITDISLMLKILLLLLIAILISYVSFNLQPKIDSLFIELSNSPNSSKISKEIGSLRLLRKRLASICMFSVLTTAMLGVQVWQQFDYVVSAVLIILIALFTFRSYKSLVPYGWV
ncbi:MAG: hypothetical protein ACW981_20605 [Candidatus Hodarchaeales archaeon]|jgi:hypothetical protein